MTQTECGAVRRYEMFSNVYRLPERKPIDPGSQRRDRNRLSVTGGSAQQIHN